VWLAPSISFSQLDVKRGLGTGSGPMANSVNSRWAYDWNFDSPNAYYSEYVPMFWSGGNLPNRINAIKGYDNVNYVLGFNEPERPKQANMTVAYALAQWKTICQGFAGTGIKLVSPAVTDNADGRLWLSEFMAGVDADPEMYVDEIAFHWYGTVNINNPTGGANNFLSRVDQYYNDYGRKVWVTEFAGLDFGDNYTTEQMNAWNTEFLKTAIPGLESRDFVTRYAWWNHNDDSRLVTLDANGLYRPTMIGDYYNKTLLSASLSTSGSRDTQDMNGRGTGLDFIFLRGGEFVNNGADGPWVARVFALANHDESEATSDFGGSGDINVAGWGSLTVAENARLRKTGSNTVSMRNLDIYNDGIIQLVGGRFSVGSVLWIHGPGTNAVGTGQLRLDRGSELRLGSDNDIQGFSLNYEMEYRGGTVTIDGVGIELNGDATNINPTFFQVNQDAVMNGSFLGNAPGITKGGNATLTLNGNSQYTDVTIINAGTLAVNGLIAGNDVLIRSGGTLAGNGALASAIVAYGGSTVTPGNSTGTLTAADAEFSDQSKLVVEIKSEIEFDKLDLSGTMTVESGATLELVLLDGFIPMIGDEFAIINAGSFSGEFDSFSAPNLTQGSWDFSQLSSDGIVKVIDDNPVVLGDCNLDGSVSFLDISPFIELLATTFYLAEADCNQDGVLNFLDISPFIEILSGN
jgi:autotransporter-associated beta strand protein